MHTIDAQKVLNVIRTLEGMIKETNAKKIGLERKARACKTRGELELVKNTSIVLNSEIDNINLTMDMIQDLFPVLKAA